MKDQQIDIATLNYYKDLYSGYKIIYVRFSNTDWVFRTLTRKEYKYILATNDGRMAVEDALCNTACVFPEEYDFSICGFGGLVEKVANIIEDSSGFLDVKKIINEYHELRNFNSLELQCMDIIKAFIPEYTYDEMETWTWQKLMYMTVRAEKVAHLRGFEWKIEDTSEEYVEQMSTMNSDNPEFIKELQQRGIDPMFYFADELQGIGKHEILDFPLIGGVHWNDEGILDVIRKQITKKNLEYARRERNARLSRHE